MLSRCITWALAAATIANAHMIMVTPTPYGVSDLNNSPLAADGSDFPCKQRGANTYNGNGVDNEWPIGSTQTLSFKGSAVHGGGSCQVSLTTDKAPTKDSNFFVIHSIVGGCPSNTSNNGNLPENPDGTGANKYIFTIPDGVAPGEYTMAWTWFNRIGNREMYMNCAPVTVTGGSQKRAVEQRKTAARSLLKRANYPSMFVANIGNGCGTSEGADVEFPNPGDSIEHDASDGKYAPPTGSCPSGPGSASGSGGSNSSNTIISSPAAMPSATSAQSTSQSNTTFVSAILPSATQPSMPSVATSSIPSIVQPTGTAPSNSTSSSSSSTGALTGPCTLGQWNCFNNGQSFQQCAPGGWSVEEPTAAGNPCKAGLSASPPW